MAKLTSLSMFRAYTLLLITMGIIIYGISIILFPFEALQQSSFPTAAIDIWPITLSTADNLTSTTMDLWRPPFSKQSDVLKIPAVTSKLYQSEGEYFKSFIHYKDDWQQTAGTTWRIPWFPANETTHITDRPSLRHWNYSIINYPIYPFFLKSEKIRTHDMITIVTQCSLIRLSMISLVAKRWQEIISLTIYISLNESIFESQYIIYEFWHEIEVNTNAILDIHLLFDIDYEDRYSNDGHHRVMYPVNHLRNVALQCAKTQYVLLTDADFVPSYNFHILAKQEYNQLFRKIVNRSRSTAIVQNRMFRHKIALIFPAFEFNRDTNIEWDYNMKSADVFPRTRDEMIESYKQNISVQFHINEDKCPICHNATKYDLWIQNTTVDPYRIYYSKHYEPYIMIRRVGVHRYDARFRGYGLNKIYHLRGLNKAEDKVIHWYVSAQSFLFHIPHESSLSKEKYDIMDDRQWLIGLSVLATRYWLEKRLFAGRITG